MTTAAVSSFGTVLAVGDGASPENFTTISEVLDINGLKLDVDDADVTSFSSTSGWREFIMTLKQANELDMKLNFLLQDATQDYTAGLIHNLINGIKKNYKITWNDTAHTVWAFAAYVKTFEPSAPLDKQLQAACKLRPTGAPTIA